MTELHIDFETRSTIELPKAGADRYAEDPTTDIWCMGYALGDGEVDIWYPGCLINPALEAALNHIRNGGTVVAHNAPFELAIWNSIMVPRYGFPRLRPEQSKCTAAMARAMALPGSLEKAAAAVGLDARKDMAGHRLMMQMCRPRKILHDEIIWWDEADKKERLFAYCKTDVEVERELDSRLMNLPAMEQRLWALDYRINQRGITVDVKTIEAAKLIVQIMQKKYNERMNELTCGDVFACTNTAQLKTWIEKMMRKATGDDEWSIEGVGKDLLLDLLVEPDLPTRMRQVVELRLEAAKTSTAKLNAMLNSRSLDGRVRSILLYHGAGTGRWAGRRIQPQNYPRPKLKQADIEKILHTLTSPSLTMEAKAEYLDIFYGPPLDVLASCLRGLMVAAPGHDLLCADFSAIEARVIAWLAGQLDILEVFASGKDVYVYAAARVGSDDRQLGKVATLGLGFGMGGKKFAATAKGYDLDLDLDFAEEIKAKWREANPKIVRFWRDLEAAAIEAVENPGKQVTAGKITYRMAGSFLWCRLPSGRALCYPYPEIKYEPVPWDENDLQPKLYYKGINSYTNKWETLSTYGGKLAENVTQAIARDLLAHAMMQVEEAGYHIVLHVHDELVAEVPENQGSLEELIEIMSRPPRWAEGCPIAAEGWRGKRYRK